MIGLETALSEITLVLFTTLAPSGALAYAYLTVILLKRTSYLDEAFMRLLHALSIPLIISMVGLIASATHLGNPSNALYVFARIGKSPLSNEVFAGTVYLGLAGTLWLYSFVQNPRKLLVRIWIVLSGIASIVFVIMIARAYSVETIITWDSPLLVWSQCASALTGGPIIARATLITIMRTLPSKRLNALFLGSSLIALSINTVLLIAWSFELSTLHNSIAHASEIAPSFILFVIAMVLMCTLGIFISARTLHSSEQDITLRHISMLWGGCGSILLGLFALRFSFYALHMTVGLGV